MRAIHKIFILTFSLLMAGLTTNAAESTSDGEKSSPGTQVIARKDTIQIKQSNPDDLVIVGNDTISMILPQKNYGRYDRGLFNYLYIPKGQWALGITASYGSLNTEDVQLLSVLDNVDFDGKLYSIKPSVSYFFKHNQALGMRFNYTRGYANLDNLSMDIDDDMNFELHDVNYSSRSFKVGLFYRAYVGLNREKRFSIFNEVSLDMGTGTSHFKRYYDNILYDTRTNSTSANLNFSPGLCIFIQDYVAFNVSFGVFGLHFNKDDQKTNGIDEGSRISSGANFKFNIFNINFGLMVVI